MEIVIICLIVICIVFQIIVLVKQNNKSDNNQIDLIRSVISDSQSSLRQELAVFIQNSIKSFG
ncbi:MAG: hypothetical protein K2G63_00730, partial [Oscillospiraceae bacterium]|nr:hypothetical protein [Oscillospiraceae bacterium]